MVSHIRIDDLQGENPRYVYWNSRKQHPLSMALLKEAQSLVEDGLWSQHRTHGQTLGEKLYRLLDGSGGLLQRIMEARQREGDSSALRLELPPDMVNLPFEIMWDGQAFLSLRGKLPILRQVVDRQRSGTAALADRPVRILFMACSPQDVRPILDYEGEEEAIIQQLEGEKLPVECYVEESGSLEGLKFALREYGPFDVVHLTGHASSKDGPSFAMESEVGLHDPIAPAALWKIMRNNAPQLLFLSGCETGNHSGEAAGSFGQAMVRLGVPMALGWGLPVADDAATTYARMFYQGLGEGLSVVQAMQQAHLDLADAYKAWPQLRLFADHSPMQGLTDPSEKVKHRSPRKETYRMLQESQVKVLEYGFVGRRRQSQRGIQVLKGAVPNKNGLLITGAAGVGKSTLCGKMVTRFSEKSLVVFSGELSESAILNRLEDLFVRKGHAGGMAILKDQAEYQSRVHALFRGAFKDVPTLLVFDNFEDNLEQQGEEFWLKPGMSMILQPFLEALAWANGRTQVIITSRYPFVLETNGRNWVDESLEWVPLMALRGADLRKKRSRLTHLKSSQHHALYEEFSGGNPRLLEWFETLAQTSVDLDEAQLRSDLSGKSEAFKQEYLANVIKNAQSQEFQDFLAKASVYRTPVHAAAFQAFGSEQQLQQAVGLTLMEQEGTVEPVYWVMPLVREAYWREVKDPKEAHRQAYAHYRARLKAQKGFHLEMEEACLYHGEHGHGMEGCWSHAARLSDHYYHQAIFREGVKRLWPLLTFLEEGKKDTMGDSEVAFLSNLALLLQETNRLGEAEPLMRRALAIDESSHGNDHPKVATDLSNLAQLLQIMNRLEEAELLMRRALAIDEASYGSTDQKVAIHLNNLAQLIKKTNRLEEAELLMRRALAIEVAEYGSNHPKVAIYLNNLAQLLQTTNRLEEAERLMRRALTIDQAANSDDHPKIAIRLGNLALLLMETNRLGEAEPMMCRALVIDEAVYGSNHPKVAIRLNNLAQLLQTMNRLEEAELLMCRALAIDKAAFGIGHPDVASDLNNLAQLLLETNRLGEAERLMRCALAIDEAAHGINHPHVAIGLNNLASLLQTTNRFGEAEPLMRRALAIHESFFSYDHPKVAIGLNNLAQLLKGTNQLEEAERFMRRALAIDEASYGINHPSVARDLNNLARLLQDTNRLAEAKPLLRRALDIFSDSLGSDHPHTKIVERNYEKLCKQMKDE